MTKPVRLEVFEHGHEEAVAKREMEEKLDKTRVAAYADGYKSGWDDSRAAASADGERLSDEVAQSLQDLSFTYHEARSHVLGALRPVLDEMTAKILPSLARTGFAETVSDIAATYAASEAEAPLECAVSDDNRAPLAQLVAERGTAPITVVADPSLGAEEAHLRSGDRETHFDAGRLLADMQAAVDAFYANERKAETG